MSTIRRFWVALLLAALVAVLIGPGMVSAAESRTVWGKIMIPAGAFIPTSDNWDYTDYGYRLETDSGHGHFTAPLTFPVPVVKIRKITLYAYDNSGGQVCTHLLRAHPPAGNQSQSAFACSSNSTANPQVVSTTAISPRKVNTALRSPYLWVHITAPDVGFCGVAVTYSYDA